MSSTTFNFTAKLLVGQQVVPLLSEIAFGDSQSSNGVTNGFIFKLDRKPSDPPLTIYVGDVINFIETKLNGGDLSQSSDMQFISQAFPTFNSSNFNSANQTLVNIYEFSINSSSTSTLFSFNLDVQGSDPAVGLIPLPTELASWLKIDNLSIAFSATSKSATPK